MNEAWFWKRTREAFKEHGRARLNKLPADGFAGAGVPDGMYCVEGVAGVLELKYAPKWPARASTTVLPGLTPAQREWLADWVAVGGRAHVLMGVAREWFLMDVPPSHDTRYDRLWFEGLRHQGRAGMVKDINGLPALLRDLPWPWPG